MKRDRQIYFEKNTGVVIQEVDGDEVFGDARETTVEEAFAFYKSLAERVPETVGRIVIPYDQDREKFGQYAYHIDIETGRIVWVLTPIQREEEQRKKTLEEQIAQLNQQNATMQETINYLLGI